MVRRKNNILAFNGRHKLLLWRPYLLLQHDYRFLSVFPGAMSYTGFRTGYNSRDPGENEVNHVSSHKLPMEPSNLFHHELSRLKQTLKFLIKI